MGVEGNTFRARLAFPNILILQYKLNFLSKINTLVHFNAARKKMYTSGKIEKKMFKVCIQSVSGSLNVEEIEEESSHYICSQSL